MSEKITKERREYIKKVILDMIYFCETMPEEYIEDCVVGFNNGISYQWIHNPFMDTSARFNVVPWKEYSWDQLNIFVKRLHDLMEYFIMENNFEILKVYGRASGMDFIPCSERELISACLAFNINLMKLLSASDKDFMSELISISKNINREYYPSFDFGNYIPKFAHIEIDVWNNCKKLAKKYRSE